jgi:hypothetical protein
VRISLLAGLSALLFAFPATAQTSLEVSTPSIVLNGSEARSIKVTAIGGSVRPYTVQGRPSWLAISSANNYTTPDTLYIQLANSICGACVADMTLAPLGAGTAVPVTVRFAPESLPALMQLSVTPAMVNLNSTQARPIKVTAPKDASVKYTVTKSPSWLSATSTNNYTTPDTLYFQLVNSNCGSCTDEVELVAEGATTSAKVPVKYGISAGTSYRAIPNHVTLT